MMKKIAAVLFVCIFMFSGCTTYNTNEKSYTYEDLSDNQKKVVDGVFEQYSKWASVHDSGKTILCTNVTFFHEDGKLIFAANYSCEPSSPAMFSKIFEVDEEGNLTAHKYSIFFDGSSKEKVAMAKAANGLEFTTDDSWETRKNILANAYYKAIHNN